MAGAPENFEAHVHERRAGGADRGRSSPASCCSATRSTRWASGRRVAARLGLGFASDVTALAWEDGPVATRGAYGGKVEVELDFPGKETDCC